MTLVTPSTRRVKWVSFKKKFKLLCSVHSCQLGSSTRTLYDLEVYYVAALAFAVDCERCFDAGGGHVATTPSARDWNSGQGHRSAQPPGFRTCRRQGAHPGAHPPRHMQSRTYTHGHTDTCNTCSHTNNTHGSAGTRAGCASLHLALVCPPH
jgi:hypothetical protein